MVEKRDIVERLAAKLDDDRASARMIDAADIRDARDEIERLREALAHTIKHGVSAAQLKETVE